MVVLLSPALCRIRSVPVIVKFSNVTFLISSTLVDITMSIANSMNVFSPLLRSGKDSIQTEYGQNKQK